MFIEKHFSFSVSAYEGLWQMIMMDPNNREKTVTVYVKAPNSDYQADDYKNQLIANAGPRLTDVLSHLLYQIESYPYTWAFSNQKIVTYGYDFETDYNGTTISYIDLTEIAFKEVNEYYNFFSPLEVTAVTEEDTVSGKGIITKLTVNLDKPKNVNHLTIDFFTEYPIELLSFLYQTETGWFDIPLSKVFQTNHSIILHFPAVFAKTFSLIIKQETYQLYNQNANPQQTQQSLTWNQATVASQSLYDAAVKDYLDWIMPTQSAVSLHQEILDSYIETNPTLGQPSYNELNRYGEAFSDAKKKLDSEQR